MTESRPELRAVQFQWVGIDELPTTYVNQIVSQLGVPAGERQVPDSIQLMFGTATQPVIVGTPEQIASQVAAIGVLPIKPAVRLVMSRERAEELLRILGQTLEQYDTVSKASHANP